MLLSLERILTRSCIPSSCFRISKWFSFTYGLGTFPATAFVLYPWVCVCTSALRACSSFSTVLWVSWTCFPVGFQNQMFWGLVSLVQDPRIGVPYVEDKSLAPQGKSSLFLRSTLIVGHHACGGVSGENVSLTLLLILMRPFYPFL